MSVVDRLSSIIHMYVCMYVYMYVCVYDAYYILSVHLTDIGIKLERAYLDEESSVAMWRYFNVSTITKEFWGQIGRG